MTAVKYMPVRDKKLPEEFAKEIFFCTESAEKNVCSHSAGKLKVIFLFTFVFHEVKNYEYE